jgi:hypothetical protein
MRRATFVGLAIGLAGCAATMVSRPAGPNEQYAPVNDAQRPGEIVFLNEGISAIRNARRHSAYKQMYNACGGAYRIDREGERVGGSTTWATSTTITDQQPAPGVWNQTISTTSSTAVTHYWVIDFSCVKGDSTGASPQVHN